MYPPLGCSFPPFFFPLLFGLSLLACAMLLNTLCSHIPTCRGPCSLQEDRPSTSNATSLSVATTRDRGAHQAQHTVRASRRCARRRV
ncbi:hypothetical protein B0H11DRAFT_2066947 [Mycena galericulata]|nr:hypothetical protein B0H11DRAFT_2066947 [Mycena galericulata]